MKYLADVVCIVPVYNEAAVLAESVALLVAQWRRQNQSFLVVVASNGSTDETGRLGPQLEVDFSPYVRFLVCRQRGRGAALREAVAKYPAKTYFYVDADLPCELEDLPRLIEPINNGVDLVTSRRRGSRPLKRRIMTYGLRNLTKLMFGISASDPQCAVKALSGKAAIVLTHDCRQPGWFLDTELIVLCHLRGLVISEVDINWIEQRFEDRRSKVKPLRDSVGFLLAIKQITRRRSSLESIREVHKTR